MGLVWRVIEAQESRIQLLHPLPTHHITRQTSPTHQHQSCQQHISIQSRVALHCFKVFGEEVDELSIDQLYILRRFAISQQHSVVVVMMEVSIAIVSDGGRMLLIEGLIEHVFDFPFQRETLSNDLPILEQLLSVHMVELPLVVRVDLERVFWVSSRQFLPHI